MKKIKIYFALMVRVDRKRVFTTPGRHKTGTLETGLLLPPPNIQPGHPYDGKYERQSVNAAEQRRQRYHRYLVTAMVFIAS